MTAAIPILIEEGVPELAEGAGEVLEASSQSGDMKLVLDAKALYSILHSQQVQRALQAYAEQLAATAENMKQKPKARYEVQLYDREEDTRSFAVCRVANAEAYYDDIVHSTLMKVWAQAPRDVEIRT